MSDKQKCPECGDTVRIVMGCYIVREYEVDELTIPGFDRPLITSTYAPDQSYAKCKCDECPFLVVCEQAERRETYRLVRRETAGQPEPVTKEAKDEQAD